MSITRIERKRPDYQANRPPLWLMGFVDLITLLLAFFILLFATTVPRHDPWNAASQSIRNRFGGEESVTQAKGQAGAAKAEKTWDSENKDDGLNLDYLYSVVKKYVAADPSLSAVTVWKDSDVVVLSFGAALSFAPGETTLSPAGRTMLNTLSLFLSKLPNTLEVVGYTDAAAFQNDQKFNSNWHLSLARANAVAKALNESGYDPEMLIRGKGISDASSLPASLTPAAKNDLARRVDLRLHLLQP